MSIKHVMKIVSYTDDENPSRDKVETSILVSQSDTDSKVDMTELKNILNHEILKNTNILKNHPDAKIEYVNKYSEFTV